MPPAESTRPQDRREEILTLGVVVLTLAAPLALGGVHPSTQVALAAAALALLVGLVVIRGSRGLRIVPFVGAAALATTWTLLQLIPLPSGLVAILSPSAHALRSELDPHAHFMPLTVDVTATWLALARAIGCLALFLLVGGFVRSRRHARRLLGAVAATAAALAVIAFAQRAVGAQAILGFYQPRSTPGFGFFGTFVDVNHAASVLALGALVAAGIAMDSRGRMRIFFAGCAAMSTGALLFSASRGALAGFAIGGFLLVTILAARTVGIARAVVIAAVFLMVGVAVTLWTSEGLRQRFSERPEQLVDNQKTRGWVDGMRMAEDYRWTGVGRGAFAAPINAYRRSEESVRLVYPENVVVQMTSEWGMPLALVLLAMVLGSAVRLAGPVARAAPPLVAGACGVLAVCLHELADFGLEMPGVAFPTIVTLAVVVGRISAEQRKQAPRGYRLSRPLAAPLLGAAMLSLIVAAWASQRTLDDEYTALHAIIEAHAAADTALKTAIARHPADPYLELLAAEDALHHGRVDAMHHLNRALLLQPTNWQAHHLTARLLASLNHPAQAALEYRLATEVGMIPDLRELARVLGVHVVDAVPQTPAKLVELARELYAIGRAAEADAASRRAVDLATARPPVLMSRVLLALDAHATAVIPPAARALLAEAESADQYTLAARALAAAGAQAESNAAIEAGRKAHPSDASLILVGAELRLAANDLAGARAMLTRSGKEALSLPERQRAEELLGDVAERAGDAGAAAVARARARLIAKQLRDMTFSGKPN